MFAEYRKIWVFGDEYQVKIRSITSELHNLDSQFDRAANVKGINANTFAFTHLYKIINALFTANETMREIYKDKRYYNEVTRLKYISLQLSDIETRLKNYGTDKMKKDEYDDFVFIEV